MWKRSVVVFLVVLFMIASTGCDQKAVDSQDMANLLIAEVDRSLDDYLVAMGDKALEQLLKLHSIQYGSFTEVGSDEVLVTFKFVDVPHASGLDRTLVLICDAKSSEAKMQKTFMADTVTLHLLDGVDGRSEMLYIGSVTYQGYTVYGIHHYDLSDNEWTEVQIFEKGVGERNAFFYSDGLLQVFELTYEDYVPVYNHIRTLFWDGIGKSFSVTSNWGLLNAVKFIGNTDFQAFFDIINARNFTISPQKPCRWRCLMYIRKTSQIKISDDFFLPFGGKLNPNNRWIKLAGLSICSVSFHIV